MNIKGMNEDMTCRNFKFEVGKEYKIETDKPLKVCTDTVFHYCKSFACVDEFYSTRDELNRFFEIELLGEEVDDGQKVKYGSNHIKILREIRREEIEIYQNKLNNSGFFNVGSFNTGSRNRGYGNSGSCNLGDKNTGCCNIGNFNSGDFNFGDHNTGEGNIGFWNSGNFNNGDFNSGFCNKGNRISGIFCTVPSSELAIFNKPATYTDFELFKYFIAGYFVGLMDSLIHWENYDEETFENGDLRDKITGGILRTNGGSNWLPPNMKVAWKKIWEKTDEEIKTKLIDNKYFDPDVFEEITGLKVRKADFIKLG